MCYQQRSFNRVVAGECSDLEKEARTLSVMAPESSNGPLMLTQALAGEAASVEAVGVATAEWVASSPVSVRPTVKALTAQGLELWSGDFTAGIKGADAPPIANSPSTLLAKVEALWETGARREAGQVALGYVRRAAALPRFERPESDPLPRMLARAHASGLLSDADFEAQRQAWIDVWRHRLDQVGWKWAAPVVWALAYEDVDTPEAARAAVALAPAFGGLPPVGSRKFWAFEDGRLGELLRLAGRLDDAVPRLRSGARRCEMSMAPIQAKLHLAQALEQTGDRPGACRGYRSVLTLWGAASPRSVTASLARERSRALDCSGG